MNEISLNLICYLKFKNEKYLVKRRDQALFFSEASGGMNTPIRAVNVAKRDKITGKEISSLGVGKIKLRLSFT